ncbi:uncharacterized protein LOC105224486 [Bactrocera dorsalis]|uniref:Uncharacterized protein LOC105224486 n=1 Tax=Bactrocera dorsalis TaxID=27457 RepID=A0A6I9UYD9_BACDO|nr:uncharacterized protein LOC105224486 [Bactrocera dorsalis]
MTEMKENDLNENMEGIDLLEYCFYHKFLLVEELVLQKNFLKLHHGRCTVIGKLIQHQNGYPVLENINQSSILPRACNLPEGTVNLRLFKFVTADVELKFGQYCEVCGEVVLWNPNSPRDNWLSMTPRSAVELELKNCDKAVRKQKIEKLCDTYLPAVNIFRVDYIDCAVELIQRHLKIRLLTSNHKRSN